VVLLQIFSDIIVFRGAEVLVISYQLYDIFYWV